MAGFVQIIEFTTSRPEEVKALGEEYRATRGDSPVVRGTFTADKDRPNTYLNIVEFPSYEAAMKNSQDPATSEFAQKMMVLCDGPAKFYNLDVLDVWTAN
ncbi:MAG: hypothetical protein QOJ79_3452 [Actinomycetota bacterium]|jgi:hypothetical protein|nr:hypothetical protein [Actinomycetota bacterium]